jgi:hypothetical protein
MNATTIMNPRGRQKLADHKGSLGDVLKLWLSKVGNVVSPFKVKKEDEVKIEASESYFDDHKGHTIWTVLKKYPRTNRWVFLAQVYWGGDDTEFKSFPS